MIFNTIEAGDLLRVYRVLSSYKEKMVFKTQEKDIFLGETDNMV